MTTWKKRVFKIPLLPLTALIFYLTSLIFWNVNLIPPPNEIVSFLESLYNSYGLIGLFIASFLEGIVYLGLYFPGSFIILLSVILSDGTFFSLLSISLIVTIALTLTSIINYWLGRQVAFKKLDKKDSIFHSKKATKGLLLSMIHPNLLAFYFFNAGIEKQSFLKVLYVPFLMIFVGLFYAYFVYFLRTILKSQIENTLTMMILILIWITIAFILENKRKLRI